MKETRKFHLVPHNIFEKMQQDTVNVNPSISGLSKQVNKFKTELEKILNDTTKTLQKQYQIFIQLFQRYLNLSEEQRNQPLPVVVKNNESVQNNTTFPDEYILIGIPKTKQSQAKSLLHHVQKIPRISWDEKGVVTIDRRTIYGSYITDLIHDFTRESRTIPPAVGYETFAALLKSTNTPQRFIGNRQRWKLIFNLEQRKTTDVSDDDSGDYQPPPSRRSNDYQVPRSTCSSASSFGVRRPPTAQSR